MIVGRTDLKDTAAWAVIVSLLGSAVLVTRGTGQSIRAASGTHASGFEVRFSPSPALRWNKTYGRTGSDLAMALVQTTDGG